MSDSMVPTEDSLTHEKNLSFSAPLVELVENYSWVTFSNNLNEICYLEMFLQDKDVKNIDLSLMDLADVNWQSEKEKHKNTMNDIIKDQCFRLMKYGNITASTLNKERETNSCNNFEVYNEYDLNDSFIDDTEIDQGFIDLELYQAQFQDYLCIEGGLEKLLKNEHYEKRLKELENIRKFTTEDQKIYMKKERKKKKREKAKRNKENEKKSEHLKKNTINEEEEKKGFLYFEGLLDENMQEKKRNPSVRSKSVGKHSAKKQSKSKNKNNSKRKRDSMKKKNEIFNANHPTLAKFKEN